VLPVTDTNYENLKNKYELLEKNREDIINTYTHRIPQLKQAAESNGEHLAQRYRDFLKNKSA
jgi:agmatine/peptidylarginine deiminase